MGRLTPIAPSRQGPRSSFLMTLREVRLLERDLGHPLTWVDVTTFRDPETMVLVVTPRCEYCGVVNPTGECARCGASIRRG